MTLHIINYGKFNSSKLITNTVKSLFLWSHWKIKITFEISMFYNCVYIRMFPLQMNKT